jgi:hypothetical protein
MQGKIDLITYERAGIPVELIGEQDRRRAIARGHLSRATIVVVHRHSAPPARQTAEEVVELQALFDELDWSGSASPSAAANPGQAPPAAATGRDGAAVFHIDYIEDDFGDPDEGSIDATDEECVSQSPRRSALVALSLGLVAVVLVAVVALRSGSDPVSADAGQETHTYRVVEPANLRKGPTVEADRVRTLRRDLTLTGTLVRDDTGRSWLRISEDEHAGLYVWTGNLERVAASNDVLANMN